MRLTHPRQLAHVEHPRASFLYTVGLSPVWPLFRGSQWFGSGSNLEAREPGANDVIPVGVKMSKNQEHPCQRAGDGGCPSASREQIFLPPPWCSIQALNRLDDAHCVGEVDLLCSVYGFKCPFPPETAS